MGNNFVLMSIFERVKVFGRVLEIVPQALLQFELDKPTSRRQAGQVLPVDR